MLDRTRKKHPADRISGGVREALEHDSARKHVTGEARYIDDLPEPPGLLHVYVAQSSEAHAGLRGLDLSAVRTAPGVVDVVAAADIPGKNDVSPIFGDDPVFAADEVLYAGQSLFAVAAEDLRSARHAARLARVDYEPRKPIVDIDTARAAGTRVLDSYRMARGDAEQALAEAPRRLAGTLRVGGQDHFYLEGQVALALPGEDGDVVVHSSTQNPSEVQHLVAGVLGRPSHAVTVEVRRMGGGFGGKETQPALIAAIAALVAQRTGRAAKLRLDRDDDMLMTGKRHDFRIDYEVGFDDAGRILGIAFEQSARCGYSADLSGAICDRAMFHADNGYYLDQVRIDSHRWRTHTVSNTAFRGFGGPQGMLGIERVMDAIAFDLGLDPLAVRRANLYGGAGRDVTPYHMKVEDNVLPALMDALRKESDYDERRAAARAFNRGSTVLKRGIALTPVKFGISFTTTHLNQAGALLHVYTDGSVQLNHGGTEMGQGLMIKVAQVVAEELQIDLERVRITATSTGKVPNTSATAASSGSDLNGKAAQDAARTIRRRLTRFAAAHFGVPRRAVRFEPNRVCAGEHRLSFDELVKLAYLDRVPLSAAGFYKTPKIHWDRAAARGRPFYYFAYGAAVSEVLVDTLTGEHRLQRVDILHDVGRSLNPAVDMGQIEGGFVQGYGWLTSEELWWDEAGRLRTHAPSTYKIPVASDVPEAFNARIWERGRNRENAIYRSKAVGEPPLMLAISAFCALTDALASVADYRLLPPLDAPATPERVLLALEALRARP